MGQYLVWGRDRPPGSPAEPEEDAGTPEDGGVTVDETSVEEGAETEVWQEDADAGTYRHRLAGCHYVVLQACGRKPDIEIPVPDSWQIRELWRSEPYDRPEGQPRLKRIRPRLSGSPWWPCACRVPGAGPCQVYGSPAPGEPESWHSAPVGTTLQPPWRGAGCLRKPCVLAAEMISTLGEDPAWPEACPR
jgi:hypothetical protein